MSAEQLTRLGPHRISSAVDSRGRVDVFAGTDGGRERPIWVQILSDAESNGEPGESSAETADAARERFIEKARAFASVEARGLVKVRETGVTPAGAPYVVTDAADRGRLTRRIGVGDGATDSDLRRVAVAAGGSLATLHRRGVLHETVGTDSVLLLAGPGGGSDGLGTLWSDEVVRLDVPGHVPLVADASDRFAAPEQLAGEAATARTDIYRMSGVMTEMAAGRQRRPDERWTELLDEVSTGGRPELSSVLARGLSTDADYRQLSAEAWTDDVTDALRGNGAAGDAAGAALAGGGAVWGKRLAAGAVAVAAIAGIGYLASRALDGDGAPDGETATVVPTLNPGADPTPAPTADAGTGTPAEEDPAAEDPAAEDPAGDEGVTSDSGDSPDAVEVDPDDSAGDDPSDAGAADPDASDAGTGGADDPADGDAGDPAGGDAGDDGSDPADGGADDADNADEPGTDDDAGDADGDGAETDDGGSDDADASGASDDDDSGEGGSSDGDSGDGEGSGDADSDDSDSSNGDASNGDASGESSEDATTGSGSAGSDTSAVQTGDSQTANGSESRHLGVAAKPDWASPEYCPPAVGGPVLDLEAIRINGTKVTLAWQPVDEFLNIFVNRAFHDTLRPGADRYVVEGLDEDSLYDLIIADTDDKDGGTMVCVATTSFGASEPFESAISPLDFAVAAATTDSVLVTWQPAQPGTGFTLHVGNTKVAEVDASATSYRFTGLAAGSRYEFGIRAVDDNNRSDITKIDAMTQDVPGSLQLSASPAGS